MPLLDTCPTGSERIASDLPYELPYGLPYGAHYCMHYCRALMQVTALGKLRNRAATLYPLPRIGARPGALRWA